VTLQDLGSLGEFIGSIAVLASLLYLALQVRQATKWQRHAAALNRATALTSPFFASSELPAVQAKIMAVDGFPPIHKALVERYDLTPEEATLWWRHLVLIWKGIEADYSLTGESPELESTIRSLLTFPDDQLYWEHDTAVGGADFREYVENVRKGK
jgi:hypothetical protein